MATETFPIRSHRFERVKRVQTVQHLIAAILLVSAALSHLTDPNSHHIVLPALELLAGVTLIVAAIIEKVRKTHPRLAWVELAGAAMTFVEAVAKLQQKHHFSFYVLSFIPPVMLLFFGLFDEQLRKRPYIGVTEEAFEMRLRMLWKRRVPWAGLTGYRITPTHIELVREGENRVQRLRITDIQDRDAALAWVRERFEQRGLTAV